MNGLLFSPIRNVAVGVAYLLSVSTLAVLGDRLLSARGLRQDLNIIARGEIASTEQKLLHAGASRVVMPAHIGAERIAEILLFHDLAEQIGATAQSAAVNRSLRPLGLDVEMIPVALGRMAVGMRLRMRPAKGRDAS